MPVLRDFLAKLVHEVGLREAGRMIERGREQVRKFIGGTIENPHPRTRKAIGELYIERHGKPGGIAETPIETLTATPLKLVLPRTLERATGEIRAIFALARKHPDAPESTVGVEQWLLRHVKSEYAAEQGTYKPARRSRRKPADPDTPPK